MTTEKPDCLTDEMLIYLDELKESGEINMFGARPIIASRFWLDKKESAAVLSYWMETFVERHPNG
jgi:hypothetical protein